MEVLFKNEYCASCNGTKTGDGIRQVVYSVCDTCKYTYEFEDGDKLEPVSSDCKVVPRFPRLQICDPFWDESNINKDGRKQVTISFCRFVSSIRMLA